MSLQVDEIATLADMAHVGPVCYEAFDSPLNSWWEAVKGPNVEEMVNRYWAQHKSMTGSHWIKVSDTSTGEILGAAEWVVHSQNPFETSKPVPEATWWPQGDLRDISNQFMKTFFGERPKRMSRPHLLLRICCTSQKARRRGVGSEIMRWGCSLADQLELEAFVEATQIGIHLYERFGFVRVGHIFLTAQNENSSAEWTALYERIAPVPFRVEIMWRPKGGIFESEKTKYSWEEPAVSDKTTVVAH